MSSAPSLPKYLLLFDGVCNLCNGGVQFILKQDLEEMIHFSSIQSKTGSQIYREHGLNPDAPKSMLFITPHGVFHESDAAIEIAVLLGRWWTLVKIFKIIPRWIRDGIYHFIASHRYRWFGKREQCLLPRPEWKRRFLD